ncbi:MAG: protein translocase subunit SecF [Patescibacteria group bacterium]
MRNIIAKRKIFYFISGFSILASIFALVSWGLKPGIDFLGGTLWEFRFSQEIEKFKIEEVLKNNLGGEIIVQESTDAVFTIRTKELDEPTHQQLIQQIKTIDSSFNELRFETIGPTVGKTLQRKSFQAIVLAVFAISLYITYAFRKASHPVSSWKYGLATIFTLFHDLIIPLGVFAYLGRFKNVEIDTNFVVAMLVIMGFSVHDTIVVFDRIREKLKTLGGKNFIELVNLGLNETLVRSINTSLTAILALLALYLWGSYTLKWFILAMIIGIATGTYSSIAVASPIIVELWQFQQKRR